MTVGKPLMRLFDPLVKPLRQTVREMIRNRRVPSRIPFDVRSPGNEPIRAIHPKKLVDSSQERLRIPDQLLIEPDKYLWRGIESLPDLQVLHIVRVFGNDSSLKERLDLFVSDRVQAPVIMPAEIHGGLGPRPVDRISEQVDDPCSRHQGMNPGDYALLKRRVLGRHLAGNLPRPRRKQTTVPVIAAAQEK